MDLGNPGMNADLTTVHIKKYPYISVHIPFYNEKNVVERSIKAATSFDYPAYEVILCDDSTDETSDKIRAYQKTLLFKGESLKETKGDGWTLTEVEVKPGVTLKHLHRTTRMGYKGGALALALKLVDPRTEFVSIFDADFVPYPDSLNYFVKYFKVANSMNEDYGKSNIAAVQGYQWHVLNKSENWITRGVRSEYAGSYVVERSGAEIYKGLKQISGSVYMIRRDVLSQVGWGTSITEDFELTLKLYNAGYKVVYTPYVQAPAECVSTLRRMVRQRMRWAEGHSFNIKKMFAKLMLSPKLTPAEKFETAYLAPYYLQAFFFLIGTFSWFLSEAVFRVRLPFWSELWGWSLILTNMVSLPLMNSVGMFLEESGAKDYTGIGSFVFLSYIIVPFQAYAAVKGFLEKEEGPWFRTPKTGRVTDTFKRSGIYRFISGILPGKTAGSNVNYAVSPYLAMASANSRFDSFDVRSAKGRRWVGKLMIVTLLIFSNTLLYFSGYIQAFAPQPVHAEQNFGAITSPAENSGSAAAAPAPTENNFQNGVLAVNTDRQVYLPGGTAMIQMAALVPKGDSICNAVLSVEVDGEKQTGVIRTGACADNNVTNTADHVLYYKTGTNGTYNIKVTNITTGLVSQNSFTVDSSRTLDVVRKTATRINPFKADSYPVHLYVTSQNDYQGEVTDQVPTGFKVINAGNAKVDNGKITWQVNLKKGETEVLSYDYISPKVSPELYKLGGNGEWQIASDNTCVAAGTGNWSTPTTWTACHGNGPIAGDTVNIAGYTITVNTASPAATSVNFTAATGGVLTITSPGVLTLSGALTLNNQAAAAASASVGGTGQLIANSIAVGNGTVPSGTPYTTTLTTTVNQLSVTTNLTINSYNSTTFYNNGAFDLNQGQATVSGAIQTANAAAGNSATFTMAVAPQTGTLFLGGATPWSLSGTGTNTTTMNGTGATVNYNGTSQAVLGTTYTTLTFSGGSGTKTLGAATTISGAFTNSTGVAIATGNYGLTFGGNFVNNGTALSAGSSPITINGAATQSIAGYTTTGLTTMSKSANTATFTSAVSGNGLTINGSGGTLNLGAGLTHTFTGDITLTAGTLNGGSSTLNENNTSTTAWGGTGSLFTAGTSTVVFGGANQTLSASATTFNILTFSGSGTKTLGSATTISSTFTNNVAINTGNYGLTFGGNFTNAGTALSAGSSPITINGTLVTQSIAGYTTTGLTTMSKTAGTATFTSAVSGGGLTINGTGGTLNLGVSLTHTFAGDVTLTAGTLNGGSSTLNENNTSTTAWAGNGPNFTAGTSTVVFGGANQTLSASATTFNILTFAGSGAKTVAAQLTVNSTFTNNNGVTITIATGLILGGNFINNGTALSMGAGGTVTITGTNTQSIAGYTTAGYTSMTKTGGVATFTGPVSGGALTINGTGGTLNLGVGLTHTFSGLWTRTAGTLDGGSSIVNFSLANTVFSGTGGTFTANAGTVNYNNASNQTVPALTYNNLTLSGGGTKSFATSPTVNGVLSMEGTALIFVTSVNVTYGPNATLQYNKPGSSTATTKEWLSTFTASGGIIIENTGAVSLPGAVQIGDATHSPTLNISGGTLTPGGNLITVYGNFANTGTLTSGSGGMTIAGTATQSIAGFTTTGTVSMTKTGGTATFTGAVTGANLTLNGIGGTLNLGTGLTHNFSGNLTLTQGTFQGGTSTMNLNGGAASTQTIAGAFTFYNLTATGSSARTIKFPSSTTTTITHSLTLTGAAGQLLTLSPSVAATVWTITPPATQSVSYVSVTYSTATSCINAPNSSGTNDIKWDFYNKSCNSPPTVSLNTPSNGGTVTYPAVPTLNFTGTDADSDAIEYEFKLWNYDTITLDNKSSSHVDSSNTLAWSHTVNTASNTYLVVGVATRNGDSVTGVTYGSQTLVHQVTSQTGGDAHSEIWTLASPTVGAHTVTVTINATDTFEAGAVSYTGVSGIGSTGHNGGGDSGDSNITVSSSPYNLVVDTIGMQSQNTLVVKGGQTQEVNEIGSGGTGGMSDIPGSATTTMGWTFNDDWWEETAVELVAAINVTLDKFSTTDAGFADVTHPADTHPFPSGDSINYTIQAGDALAMGTYYWEVEAIDPSGSGRYGAWTSIWDFIYTNTPPSVTQNSPSNAGTVYSPTPALNFTGTDTESNAIDYEVKLWNIDTITPDSTSSAQTDDAGTSNLQWSHTTVSSNSTYLVVGVALRQGWEVSVSSVSYGSQNLTQAEYAQMGTDVRTEIWTLPSPAVGTHTISVTMNMSTQFATGAIVYTGVSGIGYVNENTSVDPAAGSSLDISSSGNGNLIVDALGTQSSDNNSVPETSQTLRIISVEPDSVGLGMSDKPGYVPTTQMGWFFNECYWADSAIELVAATTVTLDKFSTTDPGFADVTHPADTHPFPSGDTVSYTPQSALAPGTYYWLVRGIDPSGSNTYGSWTGTWSFTYINIPPTVSLNTPTNGGTGLSTTPTLNFTGTDTESDNIEYEINISNGAPIALDSTSSAQTTSDGASSLQWSHTTVSSSSTYLVVGIALRQSWEVSVSSVSYGSQNLTQAEYAQMGTDVMTEIWTLASPAVGTHTITVTMNMSTQFTTGAIVYTNVSGIGNVNSASSTDDNISSEVDLASGGTNLVVDALGTQSSNNNSVAKIGQTQEIISVQPDSVGLGMSDKPGQATTKMGWTFPDCLWADSAIELVNKSTFSISRFSTTNAGFTAGHPFTSGTAINFTVQAGDALSAGTYYWQVRAIDPSGSNTYGSWSSAWTFVVSTITATSANATGYSFERKTWSDGTYFWKSFYTGSEIEFWYSTDHVSWNQDTSATISGMSNDFSIKYGGTSYLWIVYTDGFSIGARAASGYPSTTFSWGSETIIFTGTSATNNYSYPYIARDSSNYIWVIARYTGSSIYYIKTIRATAAANTLPTGAEATYTVSDPTNSNSNVFANVVPLASQNMYITFVVNTALKGCVWVNASTTWKNTAGSTCINGANTDAIATVTAGLADNISATHVSTTLGNVYLVYIDSSGHTVFQEYTSGAWQGAVTLDSNSGNTNVSISYDYIDGTNDVIDVFWIRGNHIYYKSNILPFSSGNWSAVTDWHSGTNLTNLTSDYSDSWSRRGYAEWTSGSGSPYTVNWDIIVPENPWMMIGFIPLMSYFIRRKKKSLAGEQRKC